MSFELVLTSVPKGLKPGSRGFASVAFTEGMPANYVQVCESLSGYVHVFDPQDSKYSQNPVGYSHLVTSTGGRTFSILSRIAAYGTDYTGRTNKLAHHLMLGDGERPSCGPAFAMNNGRIFFSEWKDPPRFLAADRLKPSDLAIPSLRAVQWEKAYGDAGMAGVLAQAFMDAPDRPSFLIFQPGMDLLPLLAEAQALLPPERFWDVTFSTYFTALPVGMNCAWRCCLRDSDALVTARRIPNALVIDLVERKIISGSLPANDSLALAARTGERPSRPESAPSPQPHVEDIPAKATSAKKIAQPNPRRIALKPDYTGAFRPIAPTMAKRNKSLPGLVLGGVSLLIIVVVALSFIFSSPKEKEEATQTIDISPKTNQTTIVETQVNTELQQDESPPNAIVEPTSPQPESIRQAEEAAATQAASESIKYKYYATNEWRVDALPKVTFWDTDAIEIPDVQPNTISGEGTSFYQYSGNTRTKLARHKLSRTNYVLGEVATNVAFLRLDSTNENVILLPYKARVKSKLIYSSDVFTLKLPQGSGGDILRDCIIESPGRVTAKLIRHNIPFAASVTFSDGQVCLTMPEKELVHWKEQVTTAAGRLENARAKLAKLNTASNAIQKAKEGWSDAYAKNQESISAKTLDKDTYRRAVSALENYMKAILPEAVRLSEEFIGDSTKNYYNSLAEDKDNDWRAPTNAAPQRQLEIIYSRAQNFHNVETDLFSDWTRMSMQVAADLKAAENDMKAAGDINTAEGVLIFLDERPIVAIENTRTNP